MPLRDDELHYFYIISNKPVAISVLNDKRQIPLLVSGEKMRHFPSQREGWQTAVTTAAEEAARSNPSQVYLVYKCIDMNPSRSWSHHYNTERNFWFLEQEELNIVQIQPICAADINVVSRHQGCGQVNGELKHQAFAFVPEPQFASPRTTAELKININMYLLYRTGEERGHVKYLRSFGPFKGYSLAEKKRAAENLLAAIDDPQVNFTDKELNILKNGMLSKATHGFENIIERRVTQHLHSD